MESKIPEIHEILVWTSPLRQYVVIDLPTYLSLNLGGIDPEYQMNKIGMIFIFEYKKVMPTMESEANKNRDHLLIKYEYQPKFEEKAWRDTNQIVPWEDISLDLF